MLKLSENPPILSPGAGSLSELSGRWWVAHTKARFEKVFAWELLSHHIGFFLPLVDRVHISGGKKRRLRLPLFPSYVFFCGNENDRYTAMTTNRLCQTICVVDQARLIRELTAIEIALLGKAPLAPHPAVRVGTRCRVTAGVFKGLEGLVIERARQAKMVLQIDILGQGALMEINLDLLEPVG
jgi:transcription antitermination factor NusG